MKQILKLLVPHSAASIVCAHALLQQVKSKSELGNNPHDVRGLSGYRFDALIRLDRGIMTQVLNHLLQK
jgi:hypothetical protein